MNPEADSARVKEIFEKAIEFTSTDERRGDPLFQRHAPGP